MVPIDKKSEKEKHLLQALLHLLLYVGGEGSIAGNSTLKNILFTSSSTPPTDYGRAKTLMGG